MFFQDRLDAGKKTGQKIQESGINLQGFCLVGLARGGVIVGRGLADELNVPLCSFYLDSHVGEDETFFVTTFRTVTVWLHKRKKYFDRQFFPNIDDFPQRKEITLCGQVVRGKNKLYHGITLESVPDSVIICDDGIFSGLSIVSALDAMRYAGAKNIMLAVPVIPPWFPETLEGCQILKYRRARCRLPTGAYYNNFGDTPDEEVIAAMRHTA